VIVNLICGAAAISVALAAFLADQRHLNNLRKTRK
jgi:hypothetical protein